MLAASLLSRPASPQGPAEETRSRADGFVAGLVVAAHLPFLALLNVLFIGIAVAGFTAWRRRFRAQGVPA